MKFDAYRLMQIAKKCVDASDAEHEAEWSAFIGFDDELSEEELSTARAMFVQLTMNEIACQRLKRLNPSMSGRYEDQLAICRQELFGKLRLL